MIIGIGNIGSTSFKSKIVYINKKNEIQILGQANIDKIKSQEKSNFIHSIGNNSPESEILNISGFEAAIGVVIDWYIESKVIRNLKDIQAVGFKCVLGKKNGANLLTPEILQDMNDYIFLAPVHNAPYIDSINIFNKILNVPMVGVFEPSFHYSIPEFRKIMDFPFHWYKDLGIRKFGYHSASLRYLAATAFKLMKSKSIKLITIHLGGSSSMCAIDYGKSIDTSMDFSTNSGLIQGTRIGNSDSLAMLYAMKKLGLSIDEARDEISNNAGLKSIAGIGTEDFREILEAANSENNRAKIAVEMYIDSIKKYIGSYAAILGGIDCIIFGGGIGEGNAYIRKRILEGLEFMGIKIDYTRNKEIINKQGLISADYSFLSRVAVFVVPTDEERVVAYFTKKVIEEGRDLKPEEMVFRLD